jgi:predicted nucleic acid-binding protein
LIYLDANVLIYAASSDSALGDRARSLLSEALQAKTACTSTLTLDEILWALKKKLGREEAAAAVRNLLDTGLELVAVDRKDIERALPMFDDGMDPRDAIDAAVAISRGCDVIISTDPSFAAVAGIRHQTL